MEHFAFLKEKVSQKSWDQATRLLDTLVATNGSSFLAVSSALDLIVGFCFSMALPMKSAMKAMKAVKAMKAMKAKTSMKTRAMKKKAVSKIARGKLAKVVVFKGNKEKTASGHKKADLMLNKRNKTVTKKQNAAGKKAYKNISAWTTAVTQARKELGIKGFCLVNGKTAQGKALYARAKANYAA